MSSSPETGDVDGRPESNGAKQGRLRRAGQGIAKAGTGAGKAGVTAVKGFWSGFAYPFRGAKFVYFQHPELIKFWIWPVLITLCTIIAITASVYAWHDDLLALMWSEPTGDGEGEGYLAWTLGILRPVVQILLFLVLVIIGVLVVYLLSSILAGPFNGMLSEQVERIVKGIDPPPFSMNTLMRGLFLTLRLETGKLLVYGLVMGPAFLLSLVIPVVGQAIYVVFGTFFTMTFFAVDYTDWPLASRGHGALARLRLVRAHATRMFGLGVGVWLFLMIPLVNLLFMPAAVTGGTIMILEMNEEGLLPQPIGTPMLPKGSNGE